MRKIVIILIWIGLNVFWYKTGQTSDPRLFVLFNTVSGIIIFKYLWPSLKKDSGK